MKKHAGIFAFVLSFAMTLTGAAEAANTALSALTAGAAISPTDLFYAVQSVGAGGVKVTGTQLKTFINATTPSGTLTAGHVLCGAGTSVVQDCSATTAQLTGTVNITGALTTTQVQGAVTTQAGTTYTFAATDCGTEVVFTSASTVTATVPATLTTGCNIAVLQAGAGKVNVNGSAVSPATLRTHVNSSAATGTNGQWSVIGLNIYVTGTVVLTGDGS